jgi:hypothetical protein
VPLRIMTCSSSGVSFLELFWFREADNKNTTYLYIWKVKNTSQEAPLKNRYKEAVGIYYLKVFEWLKLHGYFGNQLSLPTALC